MGHVLDDAGHALRTLPATVVGADVLVRGDIEGVTDLHVQGRVIGRVSVADLTVDAAALIDGPVRAAAVSISGRVIGAVEARTVHLAASARVAGDVACRSIHIEPGARFTGRCASDEPDHNVVPLPGVSSSAPDSSTSQELRGITARLRRFSE